MAVSESNAQGTMSDNLGKCEVRCFDVEIPFDDLKIRCYLAKEIIGFFVCQIAQAKNLTDLARSKELLELYNLSQRSFKMDKSNCFVLSQVCPSDELV